MPEHVAAHPDAPLRMSEIPERVDGARQTCDGSHSTNRPRGRNENVDPDRLGGTGLSTMQAISSPRLASSGIRQRQSADRGFLRIRQAGPRHALDDVMNALNSAKPSRVINLAYFLGSDPPRGRFAGCR